MCHCLVAALQHHGGPGTALSCMDIAHEKPRRAGEVGHDASTAPPNSGDINEIFMEYSWEYPWNIGKIKGTLISPTEFVS